MQFIKLSIPYLYLLHVLVIAIRVGATLLFAPIWGHPGLPQSFRMILVFSIAAAISFITPFNPEAYANPGAIIPTEFLIGLLLTMGIRIAFAGLHLGGQMVSYYLGYSGAQVADPQTMNKSTVMSGYFTMVGFIMLLVTNQHHAMFRALANSYVAFPIGSSIKTAQWFGSLMEASKQIFIIGWKIALPVFVASFIIDLSVGFVARIQPQISTIVVTAPLKLLVGLTVLGASLVFLPRAIGTAMDVMVLRK